MFLLIKSVYDEYTDLWSVVRYGTDGSINKVESIRALTLSLRAEHSKGQYESVIALMYKLYHERDSINDAVLFDSYFMIEKLLLLAFSYERVKNGPKNDIVETPMCFLAVREMLEKFYPIQLLMQSQKRKLAIRYSKETSTLTS